MEARDVDGKLKQLYNEYREAVSSGDLDRAVDSGVRVLEELLEVARSWVVARITHPLVREAALDVLAHYERALSFVKGAREAVSGLPPIYSAGVKEEALEVLMSSVNGLFNFVVGALLVVADVLAGVNSVA
ncbi:MAG: hypothetical protein DRJ96_02190 [Thermoprotei archaeon]|nr:hypothetical protein [Thermoproteales archaeon]RLE87752.1 MAG: hypothetical protein DRJ67_03975 [Thermoprotei archaeon]RLE98058.1 MAG: hypothetical protein DRJ96_02190 [Thermoprotei archaeon]